MKQKNKTLLVILLTLALFFSGYFLAEKRLMHKWEAIEHVHSRKQQLMELPENSVDVVFLGASGTYVGFHPARLYEQSGIRSFNLSLSLQPPLAVYYNLQEALTRHKPKIVVVDFSFLEFYPEPGSKTYDVRYQKAYCDLQSLRLKMQYLLDVKSLTPDLDLLPYICQFYNYHNRWKSLSEKDFTNPSDYRQCMMGACLTFKYMPVEPEKDRESEEVKMDERSVEVYDRLIDLCQEQGITVISVLPMRLETTKRQRDLFTEYTEKAGIIHIDFNSPDVQGAVALNTESDFYDSKHVNILGARKMSDYLGKYILDHGLLHPQAYPEADQLYQAWADEYGKIPIKMVDISGQK